MDPNYAGEYIPDSWFGSSSCDGLETLKYKIAYLQTDRELKKKEEKLDQNE